MHLKIVALTLCLASLVGCKDQVSRAPSLSNEQLLQLMDGELFEVTVPEGVEEDQFAGLAIRYSDGKLDIMGSSTGWTPGEVVKIVCFSPEDNIFRYAYFRELGRGSGSTTRFPVTEQVSPNMKRVGLSEGARLVRYSRDNSITVTGDATGDDFDVIFHVQEKSKGEQGGAGQPATRSESESEGGDKPQPEAEGRSQ